MCLIVGGNVIDFTLFVVFTIVVPKELIGSSSFWVSLVLKLFVSISKKVFPIIVFKSFHILYGFILLSKGCTSFSFMNSFTFSFCFITSTISMVSFLNLLIQMD